MENELDDFERLPERPQFLKILCILTFIGSSWLICSNIVQYFNADATSRMLVQVRTKDSLNLNGNAPRKNRPPLFVLNMLRSGQKAMTPENIRKTSASKIVTGIFCLFGGIMMWKLRRKGYYFYIAGVILEIATPFYLFGNNSFVILSSIFTAFFGLLFIIFYGMNLKSMKYS